MFESPKASLHPNNNTELTPDHCTDYHMRSRTYTDLIRDIVHILQALERHDIILDTYRSALEDQINDFQLHDAKTLCREALAHCWGETFASLFEEDARREGNDIIKDTKEEQGLPW